jgi:hypothetical protein
MAKSLCLCRWMHPAALCQGMEVVYANAYEDVYRELFQPITEEGAMGNV